jgi:flagellar hook-associated protein 3 FlgL
MRISTKQIYDNSLRTMQRQQRSVEQSQSQLSTGQRVQKPSDDPIGIGRTLNLENQLSSLDQYERNAQRAKSTLSLQEQTLSNAGDSILRLRELALQGGSPVNDLTQRAMLAQEVEAQISILMGLGNTRDDTGEYVFAGTRDDGPPFVVNPAGAVEYQGSQTPRHLALSDTTGVQTRESGDRLFLDGQANVFAAAEELREVLGGSKLDIVPDLERILVRLGKSQEVLNAQRASIGNRLGQVELTEEFNGNLKQQLQGVLSDTRDANYLEAISQFNQQLTALEAVQKTFMQVSQLSILRFFQ